MTDRTPFSTLHSTAPLVTFALLAAALVLVEGPAAAQAVSDDPEIRAQMGPKQHQKRQKRPVEMGTSGGNVTDFEVGGGFITCCSGTLGALLTKDGDHFILSNNHVLAKVNSGVAGHAINQPGMLDNNCNAPAKDFVATLSDFKKLKINGNNKVDAAIAEVEEGTVDETGKIVALGIPGNETVKPTLGMLVQKSGRTTGHTQGFVSAVNVTVNVGYAESCSDTAETHSIRFVKQIYIESTNNKDFSAGGDSGSVIYEDVKDCPRAVALLFAGGGGVTVGNKMKMVMKQVKKMKPKGKANLVGCSSASAGSSFSAFSAAPAAPEVSERMMKVAERVQARTEASLMALEGVTAIGIGRSKVDAKAPVLRIHVEKMTPELVGRLPRELDGVPVEVIETGPIRALNCIKTVKSPETSTR